MRISTYAELKTAVANWLNRADLTARIPEFIALTESRIKFGSEETPYRSPPLRIRSMETSANVTVSARTAALPTGYLQSRRFYLNTNPVAVLELKSPFEVWSAYPDTGGATPEIFSVEGENFIFGPTPDSSYTGKILYYAFFAALSGNSDTNWLLTNAPGVYLHGTLIEAYKYIRNMEQAAASLNNFCGVVNALNSADKSDRHSTPWVARNDSWTP